MSKLDIDKFRASLKDAAHSCGIMLNEDNQDTGKLPWEICAAAVSVSLLVTLRNHATHKALSQADLQDVLDQFMESAKVEEHEGPMGQIYYRRTQPLKGPL